MRSTTRGVGCRPSRTTAPAALISCSNTGRPRMIWSRWVSLRWAFDAMSSLSIWVVSSSERRNTSSKPSSISRWFKAIPQRKTGCPSVVRARMASSRRLRAPDPPVLQQPLVRRVFGLTDLAQPGRCLLLDHHPAGHPPRHLHLRARPDRRHPPLHRRLERPLPALHLDQDRRRHPPARHRRSKNLNHAALAGRYVALSNRIVRRINMVRTRRARLGSGIGWPLLRRLTSQW